VVNPYRWFVGVDWGSERHRVVVVNGEGEKIETRNVEHSGTAQQQFLHWLALLTEHQTGAVAVGIEVPRGAMVEGLLERGFAVFAINPKQLDRFRDRHAVSGAKDDTRDAFVLADSLRHDLHCYHRVHIEDPLILQIRELSRFNDDLQTDSVRLANQLREQLLRYYPQLLALSPAADEPWLWDLLELAPVPAKAARLTRAGIEKLLRQRRIRRLTAEQVQQALRSPALILADGVEQAASQHALLLLPRLRILQAQRRQLTQEITALIERLPAADPEGELIEHRDADLLLSLPGLGIGTAATMLGEASRALAQRDYHGLRCYAGLAAVTLQSGKKQVVVMRRACNRRLRNAFYHWSCCSLRQDARSREHYAALRARGHSHGRALRGVADRLLAILMAMLKSRTPYDPNLRYARQPALPAC
jgi:transposase